MTQPRIFVTYTPAPRRTAQPPLRKPGPPAMAVIAGAVLAGGALHGFGGTRSSAAPLAEGLHTPNIALRLGQAGTRPLPLLALAAVSFEPPGKLAPRPSADRSAPQPRTAQPATKARPRLDLPGFLADRGLVMATAAPSEQPEAAVGAEAPVIAPPGSDAVDAPAPALMLASSAAAETGPTPAPGGAPTVESQTYPTVAVGGEELGAVTMRGGKVHLGSLIGLLKLKLPAAEFARLSAAPAADSYVDADTLRAAGMAMTHDPAGERVTVSVL